MDRLVATSSGCAVVDFEPDSPLRVLMFVRIFDADGWQRGGTQISPPAAYSEFAAAVEFVSQRFEIPDGEAHDLLLRMLYDWYVEWSVRTPAQYREKQQSARWIRPIIAGAGLVLLLAVWGLALILWTVFA